MQLQLILLLHFQIQLYAINLMALQIQQSTKRLLLDRYNLIQQKFLIIFINQHNFLKMQANCCVFPAPKQYDFINIINHILLIPKDNNSPQQFYHHKYLMKTFNDNNEFAMHVKSRKGNQLSTNNSTVQISETHPSKKFEVYTDLKFKAQKAASNSFRSAPMILQQKYNQTNIEKVKDQIPCLFLPNQLNKQKIWVFFHGNGEDLSSSYQFAYFINNQLNITVLIMEYQGYSIYQGTANPVNIIADAKIVLNFLFQNGYEPKDIVLFGRSIGGAIAFQAASHFDPSCLILLSPFLSLKKVAEDLYGKCASTMLKQTLDNATIAQSVKCPILIIHGLKDNLVPYHHSVGILGQCKGYSRLKLAQNMTHTKFNFRYDFMAPVKAFLKDMQLILPKQ